MQEQEDLTTLLRAFAGGEKGAADRVIPLVYDELRRIAHRRRWQWVTPDSPATTSLVHEAYVRLTRKEGESWENRAHFFYFASVAMRSILIDHAKHLQRIKRGDGARQVELTDHMLVSEQKSEELLALDEALGSLAAQDSRLARIVECRFFGGLTVEETAAALAISPATVKRGWITARAWLYQQLQGDPAHEAPPPG